MAGLIITIPLLVTLYVLGAIFNFLNTFIGRHLHRLAEDSPLYAVPGLGVILSIGLILLVGVVGSTVVGRKLIGYGEALVSQIPVVKIIYPSAKQVVDLLLSPKEIAFKRVVLVEYPRPGVYVLGFITAEGMAETHQRTGKELMHIFIPYSPVPMTGMLVLVPREEVMELNLSVDEGVKLIVSGGVLIPDRQKQTEEAA